MVSGKIVWLALATSALCSSPALAQETLSPERPIIDSNGIDVLSGTVQTTSKSVGIAGVSFSDIWSGSVNENTFTNLMIDHYYMAIVYVDGASIRFFKNDNGQFVPDLANGAVLTTNGTDYVYTAPNGTRYEFVPVAAGTKGMTQSNVATSGELKRLNRIVRPNGEIRTWNYRTAQVTSGNCTPNRFGIVGPDCQVTTYQRAQSITTNTGLMLKASYATNNPGSDFNKLTSVTAINLGVDYCDPNVDQCSGLSQSWPSLAISSVTDNAGLVTKYFSSPTTQFMAKLSGNGLVNVNNDSVGNDDFIITYHSDGRVQQVIRNGRPYGYNYGQSGNQATVTVTRPGNASESYVVSTDTKLLQSRTDELGHTTLFEYDSQKRLYKTTFPEGNQAFIEYDAKGRVTARRSRAKPGTGLADIVDTYGYDANCTVETLKSCMAPLWHIDPRGYRTDFAYGTDHGELVKVEAPSPSQGAPRPTTEFTYSALYGKIRDASGQLTNAQSPVWKLTSATSCATASICHGSSAETKMTIGYAVVNGGVNLLPTEVTVAAGDGSVSSTTSYAYDAADNLIAVDGPLAGNADTTYLFWDADKRSTGAIGPDPDGGGPLPRRAQRLVYDGNKLVRTEIGTVTGIDANALASMSVAQTLTSAYDANANRISDTLTAGGTKYALTQYSYDVVGRIECVAQRMNPAAYGSLPNSACTLGAVGGMGEDRIVRTLYDAASQVSSVTAGYGTSVQAVQSSQTYSPNGKLSSITDGESNRTSYIYDGFDRLSVTRFPVVSVGAQSSSGSDFETLSYDPASNVVSRGLRDGQSIGYSYDGLNRRIYDDYPNVNMPEHDITYNYDSRGRLTRAQDASGWFGAFEYDALDRPTRQFSNLSSNTLQYDASGRRTRQTWADGLFVTYNYRLTGEVSEIRENGGLLLAGYSYDSLGRRTSITRGNGTVTNYGYDPDSTLKTLTQDLAGGSFDITLGFTYNPAGQIVETTRSNDQYVWARHYNVDRTYTTNGLNQFSQVGGVTPSYDSRGNMTSAGGDGYVYNSRNQLSYKNGQMFYTGPIGLLGQIPSANFDYVGSALVTELDGNGIRRRYVHAPGIDQPVLWYEGSGTNDRRWLHADERGSIIALSDGGGNKLAINTYDEYGIPGVSNLGRFQYTGQKWITELGMYDYKSRTYSPTLGRFLQTDTIGYSDGVNWYNYVGSDPINKRDPWGKDAWCGDGTFFTASELNKLGGEANACSGHGGVAEIGVQGGGGGGGFGGGGGGFGGWGGFGGASDWGNFGGSGGVPQNVTMPVCDVSFGAHVQIGFDVGAFLGKGGGLSAGVDLDFDNFAVTLFGSSRSGTGIGLIAGAGISISDSGPSAGRTYDNRNAKLSLGAIGGGVTKTGNGPINGTLGVAVGPQAGFELSKTSDFTRTKSLSGPSQPLCSPR